MRKKIIGILVVTLFIATAFSVAGKTYEITCSKNNEITGEFVSTSHIEADNAIVGPNPQGNVIVYTNKIVYHIGEPVDIIFKNNGAGQVSIGGPPVYQIDRFSFLLFDWQFMFPDWVHFMLIYLDPGDSWTETWDQQTSSHIQVPWGFYRVSVLYYDHTTNTAVNATDCFIIIP